MRVIIYGAGAVGSVIGGRLHQGGADVVVVARPAHTAAIVDRGLAVRTAQGTEVVDLAAVTSIDQLRPSGDDVVVITAKTQDTPAIHAALYEWNADVPVVCATNGVEHERQALRRFAGVYAMVVQLPAQFERPGEVTVLCGSDERHPRCRPVSLRHRRHRHRARRIDRCIAGIALRGRRRCDDEEVRQAADQPGQRSRRGVRHGGSGARVVACAIDEGQRAFAAAGIRWEQASEEIERYKARAATMRFDIPAGDTFLGGSTWQSLMKGATTLETDFFNGEILMLGRLHDVPTPANEFLQQFASRMLRDGLRPGSVTTDQLDAEWESWR